MYDRETVRALVSAFNVNNYDFNAVKTNFTLQSDGKKDYIVVSFDKSIDTYQCRRYLDSIKRKIIREFYGIEESNDAEILDTAKLIFDVNSFPFDISDRDWSWDKQHGFKFVTPVDEGVIFNLKSHLASSLKKDVLEDMRVSSTTVPFNKGKYLWHDEFDNKRLRQQFESKFLSRMRERYENVPKSPLKVKGNDVYIKDVFDDARFIDSITRRAAWRIGRDLQADSKSRSDVRAFKNLIMEFINQPEGLIATGFMCAPPLNGKGASILIPVILDSKGFRALTNKEALSINGTFDGAVFVDINGKTQAELPVNGSSGIYGINFYDLQISHCVITKIIESSVINKDHELSIDPELRFQALSPAQSPFNSPMHAGPSGIRTPPNQRKKDTDSGYDSNSPPKPKDSGAQSSSGGPRSLFEQPQTQKCPTRSPDGALDGPPRQWSEREEETGRMSQLVLGEIDPSQPTCGQSQLSLTCRPSSIPFPIAWDNSISLNLGVSEDSPKDTENICNEEPEKQQVTDKSDRKSSDECSEAKSQDSKSPEKKHGGGLFCKKGMPILAKLSPFKRRSVERDTMCSSKSDLVYHVTEKSSVSKPFFSFPTRIKAKSNPPSGVTSPTHEGASGGLKPLTSDERKELRPFLSPEEQKKLDSNSFSPGKEQHLYLTHTLLGKRELSRSLCEGKESQLLRLAEAQLSSPDNSSSKRNSGYSSGLPASPAVPHKESVSSGFKECEVEPVSEALRK